MEGLTAEHAETAENERINYVVSANFAVSAVKTQLSRFLVSAYDDSEPARQRSGNG